METTLSKIKRKPFFGKTPIKFGTEFGTMPQNCNFLKYPLATHNLSDSHIRIESASGFFQVDYGSGKPPTYNDLTILLSIMHQAKRDSRGEWYSSFNSMGELSRLLGGSLRGRRLQKRLEEVLDSYLRCSIKCSRSFYEADSQRYQSVNFGVINSYKIDSTIDAHGETLKVLIHFNREFMQSHFQTYKRSVNPMFMSKLKSPMAKALYLYLPTKLYVTGKLLINHEQLLTDIAYGNLSYKKTHERVRNALTELNKAVKQFSIDLPEMEFTSYQGVFSFYPVKSLEITEA